jgi:hypothetical protein
MNRAASRRQFPILTPNGALNGVGVEVDPKIALMFQSNGVLQACAVPAPETTPEDCRTRGSTVAVSRPA